MSMGKNHYVFVYGTLKTGEPNHYLLKDAANISRQCWTNGKLYDSFCGYPFLAPSNECRVYGELYLVNDAELSNLDRLEGYEKNGQNNLYNRVEQTVHLGNRSFQAFVYVHPNNTDMKRLNDIPDEDWCVYCYFNQTKTL
jgi:gamma-glutamylcyclotransferase (GGCT)/AIG2-like uncharacterized protein YtfP